MLRGARRDSGDRVPFAVEELEASAFVVAEAKAAFMDETMVMTTEFDEVSEFRFAAVDPVVDVMGVDVTVSGATGEAAAAIADPQGYRRPSLRSGRSRHAGCRRRHGSSVRAPTRTRTSGVRFVRFP